jgi:ATP-dependent Lhr-like helicase
MNPENAGAFSRFHPLIREYMYEKKWALRAVQEEAAGAVFDGDGHILIAAGTASGKTEACFFPVITRLLEGAANSVAVLYAGPLKALINDQFQRLEDLLARAEIPLWRWHGDVAGSHKERLLEHPSGILQITPESLEALLLRRPAKIRPLFSDLAFIVIDEVHAFMGNDRGSQLLCQMERIREAAGCDPRRIGLSATLGDYGDALRWLGLGSGKKTRLVKEDAQREISLGVDYFSAADRGAGAAYYRALYDQCRRLRPRSRPGGSRRPGEPAGKCVIFTNSRLEAEETVARLRKEAERRREGDIFHVHHGSVSRAHRREAEEGLRDREGARVVAATATLELGIDIGNLDRIIQIGPPLTAAGFVQRLGRSGRRGGRAELYCTALEENRGIHKTLGAVPWDLLRTVAVIQLYVEEKWTEGVPRRPLPYSLLCHQTLSVLASLGEQRPAELARRVLRLPPFREIPPEDFRELLRHFAAGEYVQKTGEGALILGLEGEGVVNRHGFYGVFPEDETYRVVFGGKELGTVHFLPPEGSSIALGGRYWRVAAADLRRREIFVEPGTGGSERLWRGSGSELHPRIARRMKQVLAEDREYPYLSGRSRARLQEGRSRARETGMTTDPFVPGGAGFFLVPWLGSGGMRALQTLFQHREYRKDLGIASARRENEYAFSVDSRLSAPAFKEQLGNLAARLDDPRELLGEEKIPFTEKYDYLLPPELLRKQYAANMLDLEELKSLMRRVA